MDEDRLTELEQWNEVWSRTKLIKYDFKRKFIESPQYVRMQMFFRKNLPKGEGKKVLEIGCSPGGWLVGLRKNMGYEVSGVDYSDVGCVITEKTLKENGIVGKIIHSDVFDPGFRNEYANSFDIVCSFGVVEHFEDPKEIIRIHLELLKKGGCLLLTIPNFGEGSLARRWYKRMGTEEDMVSTHNIKLMKKQELRRVLEKTGGCKIRIVDYVGPVALPLSSNISAYIINHILGYCTFFARSEKLSCHILALALKE